MMASEKRGASDARRAVLGSDRAFTTIDGGKGRVPPPPPADDGAVPCPITPLGHLDGKFYFLDIVGQRREMSARALGGRHDLTSLFLGSDTWLRLRFPKTKEVKTKDEAGNEKTEDVVIDFSINRAVAWLQNECRRAGLFGDHVQIRKPGIWPGDDGMPVAHCGDFVLIGNEWQPAGYRRGNTVWAAAPAVPRPATPPCDASVGAGLQRSITQLFRFGEGQEGAPIVVLGLLGTSYFGAAARWRSAGYLVGTAGSGKSTLLDVMAAASPLHWYSNDTSKAGLEQGVNGRAMPCFLDETQKVGDNRGAEALLDLVLTASGTRGTQGARGGVDGVGRRIEMAGTIVMAATEVPEMRETHLGRFAIVKLVKPEAGDDFSPEHKALIEDMKLAGPALWGRALSSWERYQISLATFRAALGEAGCAPREMDQLGAILAGWWILVQEGLPDARGAAEGVDALVGFVRTTEVVAEQSNARRLAQYLVTYAVQLDRSTARETIATLIRSQLRADTMAADDNLYATHNGARRALGTHGMRVIRANEPPDPRQRPAPRLGDGAGIWINPAATELSRIFDNSDWQGGRWKSGILELPTARRGNFSVRVGDVTNKSIWVSLADLGIEDDPP